MNPLTASFYGLWSVDRHSFLYGDGLHLQDSLLRRPSAEKLVVSMHTVGAGIAEEEALVVTVAAGTERIVANYQMWLDQGHCFCFLDRHARSFTCCLGRGTVLCTSS